MAVKIKLMRLGKVRQPHYRIVVADARTRRNGKAIETIGKYHPKEEPSFIQVDSERAQYWLGVGAQPTETVQSILRVTGDWQTFKGLPGTEGTLKHRERGPDKAELFAKALSEAGERPSTEATTPRKKGGGRKSETAARSADEKPEAESAESSESPAESAGSAGAAEAGNGQA